MDDQRDLPEPSRGVTSRAPGEPFVAMRVQKERIPRRQRKWHAPPATYAYDFGDDWQHVLVHGFESAGDGRKYPQCVAGEGRCPPEDGGGVHRYAEFLQVIADPGHDEHESTLRWVGGAFDPMAFNPAAVKFDDPKKRWKKSFERRP